MPPKETRLDYIVQEKKLLPDTFCCIKTNAMQKEAQRSDLGNCIGEPGIAEKQPASWRNAVRFVLETVWPQLVEITETKIRSSEIITSKKRLN